MLVLTKSIALWLLKCLFISLYDVNNSKVNFVFLKNLFLCSQAFTQALLLAAVFPQRFSSWWALKGKFLKFRSPSCWKMHFWHSLWLQKHCLYIVGKHFFPRLSWFADKCIQNCITQVGLYATGYLRNGNYLCIMNKHSRNN